MNAKSVVFIVLGAALGIGLGWVLALNPLFSAMQALAPRTAAAQPDGDEPASICPATPTEADLAYYIYLEDMLLSTWGTDLFSQPRMLTYGRLAEQYGFRPGTTPWHPSRLPEPQRDVHRYPSPQAALAAFVAEYAADGLDTDVWEIVTRLEVDGATATGAVLLWALRDDAVAGMDYRLTLGRDAAGWYLDSIEERYHCTRGVSEEGLCL